MTIEIFPPWSNRLRLPDGQGGFGGLALNYKPPQFQPFSQEDRVYNLPSMDELLAGTGWNTALETGLDPLIVEDDYGDYPDANDQVLDKGKPRMEWQPPQQGLSRVSEVIKGIVVADVTGVATTTVEVSLPDAGDSITATMLLPDGLTWDQVDPQYKQDDVIMVFHTPDDQWFVAGGFHTTVGAMFRARTTAAWTTGLTTTAALYLAGDSAGTPTGSTVTVTFLETYSADNYPLIGNAKEIAIFQDVDDDWTCPQLFIDTTAETLAADIQYTAGTNLLNLTTRTVRVLVAAAGTPSTGITMTDQDLANEVIYTAGTNKLQVTTRKITVFEAAAGSTPTGITLADEDLAADIQYTAGTNLLNLTTRKITVFEAAGGSATTGITMSDNDVAVDVVFTDGAPATLKCVTRTLPTFEWSAGTGTSTGINLVKDDLGDDIVYDGGDHKLKLTTRTVTSFLFAAGSNSAGALLTAYTVATDVARSGNSIVATRTKLYGFESAAETNSTGVAFTQVTSVFVAAAFGASKIDFTTRNVYVFSDAAGTLDDTLTTTVC